MFEVELLSDGPAVIGWSTFSTPFSEAQGVGGASDTFGICGCLHESIKLTETIGFIPKWSAGDIISCTIDLDDEFKAEFYVNGIKLDITFKTETGPNKAYFPAVTIL